VQEIFLAIWRSAARFDPQVAPEAAFITTVAKRRLIDRQRRRGRGYQAEPIDADAAVASAAVDIVELREEVDRVHTAMGHLRHNERRVLELSLVDGLTHSEIADVTQLPLGTVKTHARRGLHRLRSLLGAETSYLKPTREL